MDGRVVAHATNHPGSPGRNGRDDGSLRRPRRAGGGDLLISALPAYLLHVGKVSMGYMGYLVYLYVL